MRDCADLEIGLHRRDGDHYAVELRFTLPNVDTEPHLICDSPALVKIDVHHLRTLSLDATGYGCALTNALFAVPTLFTAFQQIRSTAHAQYLPLRVRLFIGPTAPELQALRWETLRDPQDGTPLLTTESIRFSRYLSSFDWRPVHLHSRTDLRALVVLANPTDLHAYGLSPLDIQAEYARAATHLAVPPDEDLLPDEHIAVTLLASGIAESAGPPTLLTLCDRLRDEYDILYLVAHGALSDGESLLWLEREEGTTDVVVGSDLVMHLKELASPPRLVLLGSCQSAGTGDVSMNHRDGTLTALGPRLTEAGIPAVLAMQGDITMQTMAEFLPVFFRELQRDGQIDRAVAVARGTVRYRPDWWMPVLFLRLKSGQLWNKEARKREKPHVQPWNTEAIRQLLIAALNDMKVTELCFDHFRPVYDDFGSGMGKGQKVQALLDYCIRQEQITKLLGLIETLNPRQYNHFKDLLCC